MKVKESIKRILPDPVVASIRKQKRLREYRRRLTLDPSEYADNLARWYQGYTGLELPLTNPVSFNEKIQWLKIYDSTPVKGMLADKYLVRQHIADVIGEDYLVPLLGVWNHADDINFDSLPQQFALKATHGCGWNIVVDNKETVNEKVAKKQLDDWLALDYSLWSAYELHYHYCEPRIIAEKYLDGFITGDLIDYKVHMFNAGNPIILVCRDRVGGGLPKKSYYDKDWNRIDLLEEGCEPFDVDRPEHLEQMLSYSSKLAEGFVMVRVDWYEVNGHLYFGELTFTPANGTKRFIPEEWNYEFGRRIDLTPLQG